MSKIYGVVDVTAARWQDYDDVLAAALAQFFAEHPEYAGYALEARWQGGDDGDREYVEIV